MLAAVPKPAATGVLLGAFLLLLLALSGVGGDPALAASPQAGSAPFRAPATGAGNSYAPTFSADGRFVAFLSHANNLVTNDDRLPHLDLFLRDLSASNTVLVSVGSNGLGGANNNVITFALSSNASVIAFESAASNLAPGDTNRVADIFARDLAAGTTTLLSRNADGTASGNGPSTSPLISTDGRYVIFESAASNLVTNDFNGTNDIFIHDLATHTTALVSVNADGTVSPNGPSFSPSISEDGLTVAFVSRATNLVSGITNRAGEIYLRFVAAGTNLWGTASYAGLNTASSALSAFSPVLSADGRFVAFKTSSGRIVRYDTQQPTNVVLECFPPTPPPPGGPWTSNVFIFYDNPRQSAVSDALAESTLSTSRDGRWLSCLCSNAGGTGPILRQVDFETLLDRATIIPPPGGTQGSYYYLTNRSAVVQAVSTNLTFPGNTNFYSAPAASPVMSADGQRFAFIAPTALPGSGSNVLRGPSGLWFRDMATNVCVLLSTNRAGQPGPDLSGIIPALSPDGALVAWDSPDPNLVEDDLNQAWDVFAREVSSGGTRLVSARHDGLPEQTGRALSWLTPGSVSGDGRRVALLTYDSSLGPNDTNRQPDAIVRDLAAGTNFTLSAPFLASNSIVLATGRVVTVQISVDGNYAVFARDYLDGYSGYSIYWHDFITGTNRSVSVGPINSSFLAGSAVLSLDGRLVVIARAESQGGYANIQLRDMFAPDNTYRLVSANASGAQANNDSIIPLISADNRWVAYQSRSTDLILDPLPGGFNYQLFARDLSRTQVVNRLVGYTTGASPLPGGNSTNTALAGGGTNAVFSADARHLVFEQTGSNVIYRHRLLEGDILSLTDNGGNILTNRARPTNDLVCTACANPSVSADGRFVAYESRGAPTNIFLRDLVSGATELVSVNTAGGAPGNSRSFTPLLSWDARYVVFASKASDLISDDTNRATDVFVRDRLLGVTHCLSRHPVTGRPGSRASSNPVLSADGRSIAFQSFADDLAPGDYNETRDVFVVRLGGGDGDGDGMDDDWEIGWFNTLDRDGTGDFDGDGASDLAEFRAGTSPADGASVLRVLTLMTGGNPSQVTLLWSASPGRRYRAQHLAQIGGSWSDGTGDIFATSTSAFAVVAAPPGSNAGFYRVLLVE